MKTGPSTEQPNCCDVSRREFLQAAGAGVAAVSLAPADVLAKKKAAEPETVVAQLYKSLNEKQRKAICFPWDHPLRNRVENNWHITKLAVGDMEDDQLDMVKHIFNGLHSDEYRKAVYDQVVEDSPGGFDDSAIAIFGKRADDHETEDTCASNQPRHPVGSRHRCMRMKNEAKQT